jgi:hypothetical protein
MPKPDFDVISQPAMPPPPPQSRPGHRQPRPDQGMPEQGMTAQGLAKSADPRHNPARGEQR